MTIVKYLLSLNRYSRNGKKNNNPKGIVLHHTENEGSSAIELRNYYDNLKLGKNAVYYSTHYIVGLDGEIIYCVPEEEIAYHRGNSEDSSGFISIAYCSESRAIEPGKNSIISIKSLIREISKRRSFNIADNLLRHYDMTGIKCPLFYAENGDKWTALKHEIINDNLLAENLFENSKDISKKISILTGIEKDYLIEVLEGKANIDAEALSKLLHMLL